MMPLEQAVENDAVAGKEDTLEVHTSFFRKLRFVGDAAAKQRSFCLRIFQIAILYWDLGLGRWAVVLV